MSTTEDIGAIDVKPSEGELKMMIVVLANMEGKVQVNWAVIAPLLGYKSGTVAKMRWSQISKKLGFRSEGGSSPTKKATSDAVTPSQSPSPTKRKTAGANGGGEKKKRMTKGMKAKMLEEEEDAVKLDPEEKIATVSYSNEVNFEKNDNDEKENAVPKAEITDHQVEEDIDEA